MIDIKKELQRQGIRPSKKSGQCFLINRSVLERIAAAGRLESGDTVLEIGAGPGNLTQPLAQAAGRVIAVENDRQLISLLKKNVGHLQNVQIIEDDIMHWRKQHPAALPHRGYAMVANIPYYLTSLIFREFFSNAPQPKLAVFLVQAEIADRITAQAGDHSLLSISVQYYGSPEKAFMVPPQNFWPEPKVDSAVVKIRLIREPQPTDIDFFRLVRVGFSARRKKLHNNLKAGFHCTPAVLADAFDKCKIPENTRAQELTVSQWEGLYECVKNSFMANISKGH